VEEEEEIPAPTTEKKKKKKKAEVEAEAEEEVQEPVTEKKKKKKNKEVSADVEMEESPGKGPSDATKLRNERLATEGMNEKGSFEVCIKNLPFTMDEDAIVKMFDSCGEVITKRLLMQDGWSRGMCFIEFSTKDAQDKAVAMSETEVEGRAIRVEESAKKEKGGKGKGKGKGGPGEKPEGCLSVMVMQLSPNVEEDDLWETFADCGTVSTVKILYDRDTEQSRGMAFIDFEATESTDAAVKKTDTELKGKAIFVKYNAPREAKGKDGKGKGKGKGGPGEKPAGCLGVMIMQLSENVEEDDLWELFGECGTVSSVKMLYDRETQAPRGLAFVDFESTESTDKAVAKSDTKLKGKAIFVKYNVPREPKGKGKGW